MSSVSPWLQVNRQEWVQVSEIPAAITALLHSAWTAVWKYFKVPFLSLLRLGHCIAPFKSGSNSIFKLTRFCLSPSTGKCFQNCKSEKSQTSISLIQLSYCESLSSYDHAECQSEEIRTNIFGEWLFSDLALHKWTYSSEDWTIFCLSAEE